jgi:hypothetical protein
MYNFIFYFIYRAKINADGKGVTRYSASLIVAIYLGVHLGLLYAITRFIFCYYWQISIARSNSHPSGFKNIILAIFLILLSYKYFNEKRVEKILNKHEGIEKFYTLKNIIKFVMLFIVPLLIAIFLVNKSVSYCN